MAKRRWWQSTPALVASGQKIDLRSHQAVKQILALHEDWQDQTWETYDAVGEVKYGVNSLAALVSRVQFFVAETPTEANTEPARSEDADAVETLRRLGNIVELSDLMRELAISLLVPGECFLVCLGERPRQDGREAHPETWFIRSYDEVKADGDEVKVVDFLPTPDYKPRWIALQEGKDTFIRLWRQHARRHNQADSHIRAILDAAEELLWWDAASRARAKSRLSDTGILAIPDDMELPAETEDDMLISGTHRLAKRVNEASVEPIHQPGTAASVAPIIATYSANEQRKSGMEHIQIDRPQDALIESRTTRCLQRIEQGINLPVGVISGLGKATHWGGGQIEESTFRDHVEPLVLLICSALTTAYLRPTLEEDGTEDPSNFIIWYDNSNLIVHQDKSANALRSVELGLIGPPAARRELGHSEKDAPTDEERAAMLEWLQAVRSSQKQGIVENPEKPDTPTDPNAPPKENEPGKRTPVEQPAAPLKRKGQSPIAASLQVMADEKIRRALEKAGNKLRSRANKVPAYKEAIRGIRSEDVARTLGREACLKLGIDDLFEGCFSTARERFYFLASTEFELNGSSGAASRAFQKHLEETAASFLFKEVTEAFLVDQSQMQKFLNLAGAM